MNLTYSNLLLVLLAGGIPHLVWHRLRYRAVDGTRLLLEILLGGAAMTLVGWFLCQVEDLDSLATSIAFQILSIMVPAEESAPGEPVAAAMFSLVASFVIDRVSLFRECGWRAIYPSNEYELAKRKVAAESAGPLYSTLDHAMATSTTVQLSLSWGKVYVGFVIGVPPPADIHRGRASVAILPMWSGFRNKDTQGVSYTDNYSATLDRAREMPGVPAVSDSDMVVALRYDDIVSARLWLPEIQEVFFSQQKAVAEPASAKSGANAQS